MRKERDTAELTRGLDGYMVGSGSGEVRGCSSQVAPGFIADEKYSQCR